MYRKLLSHIFRRVTFGARLCARIC